MTKKHHKKTSSPVQDSKADKTVLEKALHFAEENKNLLTIILFVLLLGGLGLAVFSNIQNRKELEAAQYYDEAMIYLKYINYTTDTDLQNEYFNAHLLNLDTLTQNYSGTVAGVRAKLYLARLYFQSGMSDDTAMATAVSYYQQAKDETKNDFYQCLATLGLASCFEQSGSYDEAVVYYQEVLDDYADQGFNDTALVQLAMMYQANMDYETAVNYYVQIFSDYPDGTWARFAKAQVYRLTGTADGTGSVVKPNFLFESETVEEQDDEGELPALFSDDSALILE